MVDANSKESFIPVLFDIFKCRACSNLPHLPVKCPNCSVLYCRDCILYQEDPQVIYMSGSNNPSCKVCLKEFPHFDYKLGNFDHPKLKSVSGASTEKFNLDRNLLKIFYDEIKIKCIYSDLSGFCNQPSGKYEDILRHQLTCKACDNC